MISTKKSMFFVAIAIIMIAFQQVSGCPTTKQQKEQQQHSKSDEGQVKLADRQRRSVQSLEDQLQMDDSPAFKRQLPELIAQAHNNDKSLERILLKMLINASQQGNLPNQQQQQQQQQQQSDGLQYAEQQQQLPVGLQMIANLEQAIENIASLEPTAAAAAAGQQTVSSALDASTVVDKREYNKPCSFNMISCGRNPFRRKH